MARRDPQTAYVNHHVARAQYAVRGELYLAAQERTKQGKEVILTNVGNPQALGQKPITFVRQVVAGLCYPDMLEDPVIRAKFPKDVIDRVAAYRKMLSGGSVGAYTDSRGVLGVREEVARFITERDSCPPVSSDDVFVTNGASNAVCRVLSVILRNPRDAVLVPIPQYPLYSASVALHDGTLLPYSLDEEAGWAPDMEKIRESVKASRQSGMTVRCMVVINPGNPTGQCMERSLLEELIRYCLKENIVLIADEVYQANVYQSSKPFISLHKIMHELGQPFSRDLELISIHSASKGALGECGMRGGYVQFTNCSPLFIMEIYKLLSISLSPNVIGNIIVGLMVNPPKPGDLSYALYKKETDEILDSLKRRAHLMTDAFNEVEGMTCNFTEGAMYSFPQIILPQNAINAAQQMGKEPDVFYCLQLLNETGICVVPGSGFGQKDGTFHFRTTILPSEKDFPEILRKFKEFHTNFMRKYRDIPSKPKL